MKESVHRVRLQLRAPSPPTMSLVTSTGGEGQVELGGLVSEGGVLVGAGVNTWCGQ